MVCWPWISSSIFSTTRDSDFWILSENGENIRATNLLVALWFLVFSIPTFIWVQDRKPEKEILRKTAASFKRLFNTFKELKIE